jgi:hypothetical protein
MDLSDTPSPRQVSAEKDYTGELKSIQASLNDVNKKLEALESDIAELQTIKDALDEIEQTQQVEQKPTQTFDITTDKSTYKVGDLIVITAKGMLAQQTVKLDLYSSINELIITKIVFSDSTGKLIYDMELPSFLQTGNYKLKATYNNIVDEVNISITGSTTTETQPDETEEEPDSIVSTYPLSFSLDKTSYTPGDVVWVTGKGEPNKSVVLKMTSPDYEEQTANTTALSDGTFTPVFILPSDAQAGEWTIVATQNDKEVKVKFKVNT